MSLWYDNYCYVSPLVVELLAIQKAYIVLENFLNWKVQVENDFKTAVKVLLGLP